MTRTMFVRGDKDKTGKISQLQLAQFLMQLSDIYASPEYGNPSLAEALFDLALAVKRDELHVSRASKPKKESLREPSLDYVNELKALSRDSIANFLADESKTKGELLGLAAARFSMPISQLKRMKTSELRQAINAALLHESSIEILLEEADRDGANRKS